MVAFFSFYCSSPRIPEPAIQLIPGGTADLAVLGGNVPPDPALRITGAQDCAYTG
jgi:hypothetical protein